MISIWQEYSFFRNQSFETNISGWTKPQVFQIFSTQDPKPEYYDARNGRLIGKEARKYQTWTIAGFLAAQELLENPKNLELISFEQDFNVISCPT